MQKMASIFLFLFLLPQAVLGRVLVTSIPKAGTHLLCKAIEAIPCTFVEDGELHHTYDYVLDFAKAHPEVPILLIVRDLRDVCLSYVHYVSLHIERDPQPKYYYFFGRFRRSDVILAALIPKWPVMSVGEKLSAVIEANSLSPCDMDDFFRIAQMLASLPNVTVIKFENLVGPKGGGSLERQSEEIKKIAAVYGLSLSQSQVEQAAESLFGKTPNSRWNATYRTGQIGSWKAVYTPEQVAVFKQRFNHYLRYFGYIQDDDWNPCFD